MAPQVPPVPADAPARRTRPSGSFWITLVAVLAGLAIFGAMAVVVTRPASPTARLLLELFAPQVARAPAAAAVEYLVFLEPDTPQARQALLAANPGITYVTDSILPGVIVVRLDGEPAPLLARLRESPQAGLVMKYDPALACH